MAIAFLTSTSKLSTTGGDVTSDNQDTTGATLLVEMAASYAGVAAPVLTDNQSNSWSGLTGVSAILPRGRLYYKASPAVSATHTFTLTQAGAYNAVASLAFSGTHASTPFDQENGVATDAATILAPGSITPTEDNEVVVCGLMQGYDATSVPTIDSGFTASEAKQQTVGAGGAMGVGLAYKIQTTAAAVNPTWSWTNSGGSYAACVIASFKQAAAGGGGTNVYPAVWMGRTQSLVLS